MKNAPELPGAYRFWAENDEVIYVGKAKNLQNRIGNHLSGQDNSYRHKLMISIAAKIDWIVVPNEIEALILEDALIKRHRPKFNIRYRDDKRYPIIRLDIRDDYPTLNVVRRFETDGAIYYGPYTSGRMMRRLLKIIEKHFPLRRCKRNMNQKHERPCLNFQIGRCPGVCIGKINSNDYAENVRKVKLILEGKTDELIKELAHQMKSESAILNFESAAQLRDQIDTLKEVSRSRKLWLPKPIDIDVFAFSILHNRALAEVVYVRNGIIYGHHREMIDIPNGTKINEISNHLIFHHYLKGSPIPQEIAVTDMPCDINTIQSYLCDRLGKKVSISQPLRGPKAKLLQIARKNLDQHLEMDKSAKLVRNSQLEALKDFLNLQKLPGRMEAIDISLSGGKDAVGSVICFQEGKPAKKLYKRFKIRNQNAKDDTARIFEVMSRRLKRMGTKGWECPDLILIDGGKSQLNAASRAIRTSKDSKNKHLEHVLFSIAKIRNNRKIESIFCSNGSELHLDPNSPATQLLDYLRDEAHRYAVKFHRSVRSRRSLSSQLTNLPGVGKKRAQKLINHFGSLERIKKASRSDFSKIPGIGSNTADKLHQVVKLHWGKTK